ncbi:hypothetical protein RJ639_012968 [Escallonia herrerae]|uniref:Bromo domain-containing protein n=1 Tax=Escallonia herrerae TaxID=1293975 RepID=A0AA89AQ27_9ASTE|nr:hypothetical protein RJ639_012968 [Escallonia herrerae]
MQKTDDYNNMIRQHVDLETVRTRLDDGSYASCPDKFYLDLLLLFNNAIVFYPKSSPESAAAHDLRKLVLKELKRTQIERQHPAEAAAEVLQPKPDPERSESLLSKHKASPPIVVCRKRSSISEKQADEKTASNPKPPVKSSSNEEEAKPAKEKPVTGVRSMRRSNTSRPNSTMAPPSKNVNSNSSSNLESKSKAEAEAEASKVEKEKKKVDVGTSVKKRGAADFLKRIKKNSPGKATLLERPKSSPDEGNGSGKKEQQKKKVDDGKDGTARLRSGGGKQGKEESSPSKRGVGRPPKKGGKEAVPQKKGGGDQAEVVASKRPNKRSRRYVFVDHSDKGKLPFDREWNPYCKDFENPGKPTPNNLTKHILSHIKLRGGLSIDEPLSKQQLEWARIKPRKPVPAGAVTPPPAPTISNTFPAESVPLGVPLGRFFVSVFVSMYNLVLIPISLAKMASKSGKVTQGGFLGVLQKAKGKRKEKQPSVELPLAPKKTRVIPPDHSPQIVEKVSVNEDPIFRPRWTLCCDDVGMPGSQISLPLADRSNLYSRCMRIETLERRLERAKMRMAEEVKKARDQGIRDFLDGNAGDEWLKKRANDGLEIYELGFAKAKEMFAERFPDIPLDDFVLPAVISPSGETVLPSEAGDAAASHPPGEGPSSDAPEP